MNRENSSKFPVSVLCPELATQHTLSGCPQSQEASPGMKGQSWALFPAQNHQVPKVVSTENHRK